MLYKNLRLISKDKLFLHHSAIFTNKRVMPHQKLFHPGRHKASRTTLHVLKVSICPSIYPSSLIPKSIAKPNLPTVYLCHCRLLLARDLFGSLHNKKTPRKKPFFYECIRALVRYQNPFYLPSSSTLNPH